MAVIRDSSGSSVLDYVSNAVTVTAGKTYSDVLNNCSVTLMDGDSIMAEALKQTDTSVDFKVKLDDSVKKCNLMFCAYPGNVQFDDESQYNKRLGMIENVTDGYTGTQQIDLSDIPVGYKFVAYLWVALDEDFYRPVPSQPIEIVDANGAGFKDYTYPDIYISDSELNAGDTKLHLTLTGDERLFKYAEEGKISMHAAVAQYPDGGTFDFEGESQESLLSLRDITSAFSDKEVTLSAPLKAGCRVRAVVYWTQNIDIFVPKGNDYEKSFGRPDDSVKVKSPVSASFDGEIYAGDTSVKVNIILLKILLYFVFMAIVSFVLYKILKNWFMDKENFKRQVIAVIGLCLLLAYISEEYFGVADITGAFVTGLIISAVGLKKEKIMFAVDDLSYAFLSPIFFVSIGLKLVLPKMSIIIVAFAIVLSIVAVISKLWGCALGAKIFKFSNKESLQIGAGMVSRGEVALIVANKGVKLGIISNVIFAPILIVVIITTIIAPILLKIAFNDNNLNDEMIS